MTDVKPKQSRKAPSPILVTEFGIVTDVKPMQSKKTPSPILVTELGIVTDVKLVQYLYLEVIVYQLFVVNTVEKWIGFYLWVHGK